MKFNILVATAMLSSVFLMNKTYANANVVQAYPISGVQEVIAGGGIVIEITQSESESLQAETTAEVMKRVKVDLSNHKLTLEVKSSDGGFFTHYFGNNKEHVKFRLSIKQLNLLELSGAAQASVKDYHGEKIEIKNSGAAQVNFSSLNVDALLVEESGASHVVIQTLNSKKVDVELSGASNFEVKKSGVVQQLNIEASGASNYEAKNVVIANADANASGASHIEINATDTLHAEASGASHIDYYGTARANSESTGASHINGHQ